MQDTVVPDTVDTIPAPPPRVPSLGPTGEPGWAEGVWEWDRDALLRLPDLSLLHLLERLPGVVPVRADLVNQPEGAAVLGVAAGAIRYVIDGFVVDPLTSPTFDPARLSLLALQRVRVERRVTGATVWIETLAPDDPRPKSVIEAGTGDFGINLFRGIFLAPRVLGGGLGLGFERLSADGTISGGTSNHNVSWLKWTWARDSTGLQVEYRQSTMERQGVGLGLLGTRRDWAVRARGARGPLTAELYTGGSSVDNELGGEGGPGVREGVAQGGVRLGLTADGPLPMEGRVALRFRGHPRLPDQELDLSGRVRPVPWLAVEGELLQGWWADRGPTGRWSARAVAGPFLGLTAFAAVDRGGPLFGTGDGQALPGLADSLEFRRTLDGRRIGGRFQLGGLVLGAAALSLSADTTYAFGLDVDPQWISAPGGETTGFEAMAQIPTGLDPFTLEAWYVELTPPEGWVYTPVRHWRAGLVYHHRPLPSGNLELFARVEHVFRGRMHVPAAPGDGTGPATQRTGAYRASNLELTIRVLSVRAFLRWENMFHRLEQTDIPEFQLPGQHILWGVKWEFWN